MCRVPDIDDENGLFLSWSHRLGKPPHLRRRRAKLNLLKPFNLICRVQFHLEELFALPAGS